MFAENEPAMKRNKAVLNKLSGKTYTIEANYKIPENRKYTLGLKIVAQNQKQTNTGGLAMLLKLKIGAKVMLTVNIDIQDRLINDQTGIIGYIEFAQGSACKVYVKFFDEKDDTK